MEEPQDLEKGVKNKNDYTQIDWEKTYTDEEFAELSEELRDRPGLYGDEIVLIAERDSNGKLVPRMEDSEVSEQIVGELNGQLRNWNMALPRPNRVHLHLSRSCILFNQERRHPDLALTANFAVGYNAMRLTVTNPLPSPDFVVKLPAWKTEPRQERRSDVHTWSMEQTLQLP